MIRIRGKVKLTPIEKARNIGPVTAKELKSIGLSSLEKLKELGWKEACFQYGFHYPERLNLNAFCSVIGAIQEQDWRSISPELKEQAKQIINDLK